MKNCKLLTFLTVLNIFGIITEFTACSTNAKNESRSESGNLIFSDDFEGTSLQQKKMGLLPRMGQTRTQYMER